MHFSFSVENALNSSSVGSSESFCSILFSFWFSADEILAKIVTNLWKGLYRPVEHLGLITLFSICNRWMESVVCKAFSSLLVRFLCPGQLIVLIRNIHFSNWQWPKLAILPRAQLALGMYSHPFQIIESPCHPSTSRLTANYQVREWHPFSVGMFWAQLKVQVTYRWHWIGRGKTPTPCFFVYRRGFHLPIATLDCGHLVLKKSLHFPSNL